MNRRDFVNTIIGSTAVTALPSVLLADANSQFAANKADALFHFDEPFDGAILHERHGQPVMGQTINSNGKPCLRIRVSGTAPVDLPVEIECPDGTTIPAVRQGDHFTASVELLKRFSTVKAKCKINGQETTIKTRPVWLQNSFKRYRFQIDDSSFFLRDIHQKNYTSIFECFWLNGLRKLHKNYGARFAVNCFYSTPEKDFDMSMMSDKYKSEWNDNADWLRLTFHAKNEFPNKPYENATPEELAADFDSVNEQIKRFAGHAFSPPGIVHWGTAKPQSYRVFRERGTRTLSGYFTKSSSGAWSVSWQLPESVCEYMSGHDGWFDYNSGLVFSKLELVCNTVPLKGILPILQASVACPQTAEVLDFLTHEQYFWPYYKRYLPDHFDRLETVIRFATEMGYKPVWHNEGFYSVPD
ncbi:MAG: hypothetical protein PHQ75_06965 [Thermoguttaceae bacterium]|nr:hypothetical protein [Thermoguttaceae bacterium]